MTAMDELLPYLAQQTSMPDAVPTTEAPASPQAPTGSKPGSGGMETIQLVGMMALLFALMYFLMIRPQRKEEKRKQEMQSGLKKGDSVVTTSGLVASVATVKEDTVILNVDGTRMEFLRSAINQIRGSEGKAAKSKPKK